MTPDPALADRALAAAERLREIADRLRRGRALEPAVDGSMLDLAARLLGALARPDGPTPRRDTPARRPTFGPFDERRGGAGR